MLPRSLRLPPALLVLCASLATSCGNDCVDMCQQIARWVDECGMDWEAAFPKRNWTSVEDCYDAHWDVDDKEQKTCSDDAQSWAERECY